MRTNPTATLRLKTLSPAPRQYCSDGTSKTTASRSYHKPIKGILIFRMAPYRFLTKVAQPGTGNRRGCQWFYSDHPWR